MTRLARRLYWLRHHIIHWLDCQTTEQLGWMALGVMLFCVGLQAYFMKGW